MGVMIATFCLVFMRAIQQQNVIHGRYKLAMATSYLIATTEIAVVLFVVSIGWHALPWMGTGGALGVVSAMYAHRRWVGSGA